MRRLVKILIHAAAIMAVLNLARAALPYPGYQALLARLDAGAFSLFAVACAAAVNRYAIGALVLYLAVVIGVWPDVQAMATYAVPIGAATLIGGGIQRALFELQEEQRARPPAR